MERDKNRTNFLKPYLNYLDNGSFFCKPLKWMYAAFAILNILIPFFVIYQVVSNDLLDLLEGKYLFVLGAVWFIMLVAGILSFQLWWSRKEDISKSVQEDGQFVVTPVFALLIQTFGEWIGTWIATIGFLISLLMTFAFGDEASFWADAIGLGFLGTGFFTAVTLPIIGFFVIITTRFMSEQFKVFVCIANNTARNANQKEINKASEGEA